MAPKRSFCRVAATTFVAHAIAATGVVMSLNTTAAAARPVHFGSPIWWSYTDPVPPPPVAPDLWNRFWFLYVAYSNLPSPKPMSFSDWIARHGIVDPVDHHAMLMLYRWFGALP